ncbi:odorant receptor Or2-like [Orussus abietinus]|uniref:odorant receptor Or2-like n=1 Tax=Orussus abietinus TaxID=222816 RepID=UPI000C715BC6|nr:odorant receptor Or2-like [Orussus abietinus]
MDSVGTKISLRPIEVNYHLSVSLKIIQYIGTWLPKGKHRSMYKFYTICSCITILGIYLFVQIVNLITIWGDIEKMVAGAFLLMTNTVHALKVVVILRCQKRIQLLLDTVNSEMFNRCNDKYKYILNYYTWSGIFHHIAYQSFGTVAVVCWGFTPIANIITGKGRHLPMDGWYPYDTTKTPAFEITCLHQSVAVIIGCFHNVAMDTLVTGLLTVACCQLEILKCNIYSLGKQEHSEEFSISEGIKDQDSPETVLYTLKRHIQHHNVIISFVKEIENIFGTTILLQFFVNGFIICISSFHIAQMKSYTAPELIGMTMYMCCMTYQIFIYCWHGNELYLQSQSVALSAYSGAWWNCSQQYKRSLLVIIARANKPFNLTAGNLMTISLKTFMEILRTSYSLFTVLQSTTMN